MSIPAPHPQTFGWIKGALDGSMDAVIAQVTLAERDSDFAQLSPVPGNLHQIHGSLIMVELDAAGILAEDLETLCNHITRSNRAIEQSEGLQIMRRGVEALQGYIDSIARQTPISPLSLVDQINAVRAAIDKPAISSLDLFSPPLGMLSFEGPDNGTSMSGFEQGKSIPDDLRIKLVAQLRKKFRRALVSWLANNQSKESLKRITELLQHLFKVSTLDISQQLWWVASGFVEAVDSGDLDASSKIKSQFARLDNEISRLEEETTTSIAADPPDQLLREMLYYIGGIENADSARIREIQESLELPSWFHTGKEQYETLVAASNGLAQLQQQYGAKEFDKLEQLTSEYFNSVQTEGNGSDSQQLNDCLQDLAKKAGAASLGNIETLTQGIAHAITSVGASNGELTTTSADIKIASAILFIRDSVADPAVIDATWAHSVISHQAEITALLEQSEASQERALRVKRVAQVENHHARSVSAKLVREVLGQIEALVARYQRQEHEAEELAAVAEQLAKIASLFEMANIQSAAGLSRKTASLFTDLAESNKRLDSEGFEQLAFVIAALGSGADQLVQPGPSSDMVLEIAFDRIDKITEGRVLQGEVEATYDHSEVIASGISSIDAEDLVSEKFAVIVAQLDGYRQSLNSNDAQSFERLRDSFAELEEESSSSGFEDIAELADLGRSLGDELARGRVNFSPDREDFIGLLVRQMKEVFPEGIQNQGAEQTLDLDPWRERFDALLDESDHTEQTEDDRLSNDISGTEIDVVDSAASIIQLDQDLKSIFVEELGAHILRLKEQVAILEDTNVTGDSWQIPLEAIDECVHTLAGNCRNLGLDEAAYCAVSGLELLQSANPEKSDEEIDHFRHCIDLLDQVMGQVRQQGSYDSNLAALLTEHSKTAASFEHAELEVPSIDGYSFGEVQVEEPSFDGPVLEKLTPELEQPRTELEDSASDIGIVEAEQPTPEAGVHSSIAQDSQQAAKSAEAEPVDTKSRREQDSAVDDGAVEINVDEDIDEEIRLIFIEETEGILGRINGLLIEWRDNDAPDSTLMAALRREFHTLKGSAAATGFNDISALSHNMESLMEEYSLAPEAASGGLLNVLEEIHDGLAVDLGIMDAGSKGHLPRLNQMVNSLITGDKIDDDEVTTFLPSDTTALANQEEVSAVLFNPVAQAANDAQEQVASLSGGGTTDDGVAKKIEDGDDQKIVNAPSPALSWMPAVANLQVGTTSTDEVSAQGMLRINNNKLAEMINASGELGLLRTQLQNALDATSMDLDVLRSNMVSMREGLRELELEADAQIRARPEQQATELEDEFDPLQLDRFSRLQAKSREVTELLEQLTKVERDLENRTANLGGVLQHQKHVGDQLQSGLMSARMVSVGQYLPRLRYLVRETARQVGKSVEIKFSGGDIQVDRQVIETMMAPFEHMIRNAVVHGIEAPSARLEAGKKEAGMISINITQQGSELVVVFADDGGGLQMDKLSNRAIELGLVQDKVEITEVDLLQVIAQPGFSTSDTVSMGSGRGVGMDVVYQSVRDLGGSMNLTDNPGKGVSFQFRLPVTLAVTQALLVVVGNWRLAIRSRTIERLIRVSENQISTSGHDRVVTVDDREVPLISIRSRLGEPENIHNRDTVPIVLVRLADRLAAFEVDRFEDSVNIVSKNPGRQLASIPEISGVTVLGDSTIVLILDPEAFIERIGSIAVSETEGAEEAFQSTGLRRVLVVDDSLVVRKVMQKDLEADGLEVETAIDGVNALEVLERSRFDIALVDIEMPRMNGYELLEQLRMDPRYQYLPIIIITSRSGSQHRQRAMDLGADGYITKPYDIGVLDQLMRDVIANKHNIH